METEYGEGVARREHDYGEYIESIDFVERVRESLDESEIVEGVAELFLGSYSGQLTGRQKRSQAYRKAKSLVRRGGKGNRDVLPGFRSRQGLRKAVKEAVEKGYIRDVRFKVPWHPLIVRDRNKLSTFPHHHEYAVLWTGRKRYEFETEEYIREYNRHRDVADSVEPEELFNLRSVLRKGFISPGNQHHPEDKTGGAHQKMWGIYLTWDLKKANAYGLESGVVLEVEAPTRVLRFGDNSISGLEEWYRHWDSPEKFTANIDSLESNEVVYTRTWGKDGDTFPVLPLKYVNGVRDKELNSSATHFYPLKTWASRMAKNHPEKFPPPSEFRLQDPGKDDLNYTFRRVFRSNSEYRKARKFEEEVKAFTKFLDSFRRKAETIEKKLEKLKGAKNISRYNLPLQDVHKFNEKLGVLEEECEKITGEDPGIETHDFRELVKKDYFRKTVEESGELEKKLKRERDYIFEVSEKGDIEKAEEQIEKTRKLVYAEMENFDRCRFTEEDIKFLVSLTGVKNRRKEKELVKKIEESL
ncbi:MAG: hypothetical protein ABEJ95_03160 [Candidatus Nanohalobium sp.]